MALQLMFTLQVRGCNAIARNSRTSRTSPLQLDATATKLTAVKYLARPTVVGRRDATAAIHLTERTNEER